jgi:hypothetical protein
MSRPQDAAVLKAPDLMYAALYARVSTEDQGRGFSIPTQIEAGHKLAARETYTVAESPLSKACKLGSV